MALDKFMMCSRGDNFGPPRGPSAVLLRALPLPAPVAAVVI